MSKNNKKQKYNEKEEIIKKIERKITYLLCWEIKSFLICKKLFSHNKYSNENANMK